MTEIRCPLEEAAERHGQRPAVVSGSRVVSYAEFHDRVAQMTAALRQAGCNPGERVAILAPNSPDYLVWFLAVLRLGAVCCPMNTRLPNRTVADLLRRIECRKLVAQLPDEEGLGDITSGVKILQGGDLSGGRRAFGGGCPGFRHAARPPRHHRLYLRQHRHPQGGAPFLWQLLLQRPRL